MTIRRSFKLVSTTFLIDFSTVSLDFPERFEAL